MNVHDISISLWNSLDELAIAWRISRYNIDFEYICIMYKSVRESEKEWDKKWS